MTDIFHQNSFEKINSCVHKLRTYAIFKKRAGIENYLVNVKNISERKHITKFRLSNHRLMIEVGRHKGLIKEERFCPFCSDKVEDEYHFLMECSTYREQREVFLGPILRLIPNFSDFSSNEKIEILMCEMDNNICKYISNCMDIRAFLESKPKRLN